ncbi:hypothetical protein D8674_012792 [Pyrus ussuriensis x Pyrus communis]|uniref:Uncharacterized protein n=1 Tax=Pyrus ussuriensis x Pyrus communis TaxID=2448454 RepID=A0A5N5GQA9_9ROSA|nr:hypothetical protein D8674_012792 [Pyrus ussuriensis x Pyrus communis]
MTHFKSLSVIMTQGSCTYSFSSVVLTLCSPNAPPLKPMRITVPKTQTASLRGQKRKQEAAPQEQGRQKKHRSKVVPEKEEDPYKELGPIGTIIGEQKPDHLNDADISGKECILQP